MHGPIYNITEYPINALVKLAQEATSQSAEHIKQPHTSHHITLIHTAALHMKLHTHQ